MSVIVAGVRFFALGAICLAPAVWTSRTRSPSIAPAPQEASTDPAPRRVATTKVAVVPPSHPHATAHRAPAPPRESHDARGPAQSRQAAPMGWYPVDGGLSDERFWDGRTWRARRQLVVGTWSSVPRGG